MAAEPTPFRLHVAEAALEDLRERLARTRFPDEPPLAPWSTGTSLAYLHELGIRDFYLYGGYETPLND